MNICNTNNMSFVIIGQYLGQNNGLDEEKKVVKYVSPNIFSMDNHIKGIRETTIHT